VIAEKHEGSSNCLVYWRRSMSEKKAEVIDPNSREVETRRIGLQDKLAEKVVDAKLDTTCQKAALAARQTTQDHE
jgi:hypothetical protein